MTGLDFERLVETHQHRIYGFALSLCANPHDAEEIAQETFIKAHLALAGYGEERVAAIRWSAWLHRIALNTFRNRIRVVRNTVPIDSIPEPAANGGATEDRHDLRAAVGRLPARYRDAIVLRHVQGFSYSEIAGVLGVPEGTIKSDVHRGLALLREELS